MIPSISQSIYLILYTNNQLLIIVLYPINQLIESSISYPIIGSNYPPIQWSVNWFLHITLFSNQSIHKINLSNKSTNPIINNLSNHWTPSLTYHITLYSNQLIHPNIDPNHWSIKSFVSNDYNIDLIKIDSRYLTIHIFHVL